MPFRDRVDAGQQLAAKLTAYVRRTDVLVLALPRGGIPVGVEVAKALQAPLDVLVVRRIVAPENGGITIGAIAAGDVRVIDHELCRALNLSTERVDELIEAERTEIDRRDRIYHQCVERLDPRGRTAVLVDDGMATGASMRAAVLTIERSEPAGIVVAVPVASAATCAELRPRVRDVVYCYSRDPVYAVGLWYERYPRLTDDEACRSLREVSGPRADGIQSREAR